MSIDDPVVLTYDLDYAAPWTLVRGRETFYDENRVQRRWDNPHAAIEWAKAELGVEKVVNAELVDALEGLYQAYDKLDHESQQRIDEMLAELKVAKKALKERPTQIKLL